MDAAQEQRAGGDRDWLGPEYGEQVETDWLGSEYGTNSGLPMVSFNLPALVRNLGKEFCDCVSLI